MYVSNSLNWNSSSSLYILTPNTSSYDFYTIISGIYDSISFFLFHWYTFHRIDSISSSEIPSHLKVTLMSYFTFFIFYWYIQRIIFQFSHWYTFDMYIYFLFHWYILMVYPLLSIGTYLTDILIPYSLIGIQSGCNTSFFLYSEII